MKLAPTVLVLAAFGVLIWVSNQKPSSGDAGTGDETAHAAGATPHVPGKSTPAAAILPPMPRHPDSVIVTVVDPAGQGQYQLAVTLVAPDGKTLGPKMSDIGGRAAFDAVAAGRYAVRVSDPDFLYTAPADVTVDARPGVANDVKVAVARGTAGITGRLVDGGERPLADHAVELSAGGTRFTVNTDAKGRFVVNGLAASIWTVTPAGFPDQASRVSLADGQIGETALRLAKVASVAVELSGSHLHPAHFVGGEVALLRKSGDGATEPVRREMKLFTDGTHEHGNVAKAAFDGLAAGNFELDVIDAGGRSLLATGSAWARPVPVTLAEGDARTLPLKTGASARGAGIVVPGWAILLMCVAIGAMMLVTPVLFPPPIVAKRPLGIQR
ncbi:MAG: carboxypeptidase regulatory-like domain-containing protein [Planctomycetes bacterium]|nr:carboxypeptidase regulatory-like domain-containing protein [Planctomycetota bacterium]